MPQLDARGYAEFFEEKLVAVEKERSFCQRQILYLVVAVLGLLLLLHVRRPIIEVSVWVLFLLVPAVHGIFRLREAFGKVRLALEHLRDTARFLGKEPDRESLIQFIGEQTSLDDGSNVPEAMYGLAISPATGGSERAAANFAFAQPSSELANTAFLRTALVLGGLFGTVFFFALKLSQITPGNIWDVLLPYMQGALMSTLTGIVCAVFTGRVAAHLERQVDQSVWQTEAFFAGELRRHLSQSPLRGKARSELDLWESLQAGVADLTARTEAAYARMADNANEFSLALLSLGEQLRGLPAITVPPELANLGDAAARFSGGVEQMDRLVRSLLETVATLNVYAPAQMLAGLAEVKSVTEAARARIDDAAGSMDAVASELQETLRVTNETVGALPANMDERLVGIHRAVDGGLGELRRTTDAQAQDLAATRTAVVALSDGLATTTGGLAATCTQLSQVGSSLQYGVTRLAVVERSTVEQLAESRRLASGVQAALGSMDRVHARLGVVEQLRRWCEQVTHVPMMRLLWFPRLRTLRRLSSESPDAAE
jgi:hypothetical protein